MNYKLYSLLCLSALTASAAWAAGSANPEQIQSEINQLSSNLAAQDSEMDTIQTEITRLEKKLGEIANQSFQTEKKILNTEKRLTETNNKKIKLESDLEQQKTGLSQQLQAMYAAGDESYLRLLLREDEPAEISRTIHYFKYLNEDRLKRIQSVRGTLSDIQKTQTAINTDHEQLQTLTQTLKQQKAEIEATLSNRSNKLGTLEQDSSNKRKRLSGLEQAEVALQSMVGRIADASSGEQPVTPQEISETTPSTLATVDAATTTDAQTVKYSSTSQFSTLKGKMSWPVQGKIVHAYNSRRNEKQRWTGVVISASGGSKVKAIANGRVAFSGWMNGYGHLIIIDHDKRYMSLYGYNRAVYKREGDKVAANEVIAAVGNSGGQAQNSLYFEIRQETVPQNPARWCRQVK